MRYRGFLAQINFDRASGLLTARSVRESDGSATDITLQAASFDELSRAFRRAVDQEVVLQHLRLRHAGDLAQIVARGAALEPTGA